MVRACAVMFLLNIFNSVGIAQTIDTSYALFWYKGKKLNDTSLLIPSGQTVTFLPSKKKMKVNTPKNQDVLQVLIKEIKQSDQRKSTLSQLIIKSEKGPLNAGFVYHLNRSLDAVKQNFQLLANNEMELEISGSATRTNPVKPPGLPPEIAAIYEEVLAYAAKIRNTSSIPSPPAPASVGLDYCYPCDAERKGAYQRDANAFIQWYQEESEMLSKAIKVLGHLGNQKVKNIEQDTTRRQTMMDEMFEAFETIFNRLGKKLLLAWTTYKNDESKLPFLAEQLFSFIRAQQLMGLPTVANFPEAMEIASTCVESGFKKLEKAKQERDFKILLNISWIVGLFRTAELLGIDPAQFNQALSDFITLNRFKVNVDARAKMSNEGTVMAARMTGENIFGAVPDSNCILKWTLLSPDNSKMKFNLDEAIFEVPDATASYAGTKNWKTHPANIQLDFCEEQKDTFLLDGFLPDGGEETWIVQGEKTRSAIVTSLYSGCFTDVERIKAMAADPALQAKMEQQMKEKHQQFMASYQGAKDPSKMTPAEIQKMNEAMLAARDIGNIIQSVSPFSFLCKDRLRNKQKLVFESVLDGKQLNPQNTAIEEAILKVKIEHVEND